MVTRQRLARVFKFCRGIPEETERAIERDTLRRRILQGTAGFDDIKRLNSLDDLDGDWGCKLLRALAYKLSSDCD